MDNQTAFELDHEQTASVVGAPGINDQIDSVLRLAKREAFLQQIISGDGLDIGAEALSRARPRPT